MIVRPGVSPASHTGRLTFGCQSLPCALGRAGIRFAKREGDHATPAGQWSLGQVLYRPDRVMRPQTALPCAPLKPDAGWCDDAAHPMYNRPVRLAFAASAERLWRDDHLYDILVILGHNQRPRIRGHGSAIFFHLARPDLGGTEGCIAVSLSHMRLILQSCRPGTRMVITGPR